MAVWAGFLGLNPTFSMPAKVGIPVIEFDFIDRRFLAAVGFINMAMWFAAMHPQHGRSVCQAP